MRAVATKTLSALNYDPCEAGEVVEALDKLMTDDSIQLLLSDVALPGGANGPQFVSEIRDQFPNLKVIFMSGFPPEAAKQNGLFDQGSTLLSKPFERGELAKALAEAFSVEPGEARRLAS